MVNAQNLVGAIDSAAERGTLFRTGDIALSTKSVSLSQNAAAGLSVTSPAELARFQ